MGAAVLFLYASVKSFLLHISLCMAKGGWVGLVDYAFLFLIFWPSP